MSGVQSDEIEGALFRDSGVMREVELAVRVLADLRTLRDAAAAGADKTMGASVVLAVSGNGKNWGVYLDDRPVTERGDSPSFEGALHAAAEKARKLGLAR